MTSASGLDGISQCHICLQKIQKITLGNQDKEECVDHKPAKAERKKYTKIKLHVQQESMNKFVTEFVRQ